MLEKNVIILFRVITYQLITSTYLSMSCFHFFQSLSPSVVQSVVTLATKMMLILIFYRKEPRTVPLIHEEEASSNIETGANLVLSSMAMSLTDCSLNCRYDFLELFSL